MKLLYKSTRGEKTVEASKAIIEGICEDGGLYVPVNFPQIDMDFEMLGKLDYKHIAYYVLEKFLTDFDKEEIKMCVDKAYDDKFKGRDMVTLNKKGEEYFLELYHGPTLAFKDMALSILPYLLKTSCKKLNIDKEIVILTATSGDTGKAALEGFKDVEGVKIIVFFPKEGVSDIQKRQMVTQEGKNTFVIGIEGNFDDAQRGVKEIFNKKEFNDELYKNGYILSSANSINIGRLLPQVIYYIYSYVKMLHNKQICKGEKINIAVPTGNFGNILAAYYAKKMGLPINKFICASNENNVLTKFFENGVYDKNREFKITKSPSMDILVSSNLERLLYEINNCDENKVKDLMNNLQLYGKYSLQLEEKIELKDFYGGFSTDKECLQSIKELYDEGGYVIDTHGAVAYKVYKDYRNTTKDLTKTIIACTASPFKFTRYVSEALGIIDYKLNDFELLNKLSKYTNLPVPKELKGIDLKPILHKTICRKDNMEKMIKKILKL